LAFRAARFGLRISGWGFGVLGFGGFWVWDFGFGVNYVHFPTHDDATPTVRVGPGWGQGEARVGPGWGQGGAIRAPRVQYVFSSKRLI
jgi:hypothetical protein